MKQNHRQSGPGGMIVSDANELQKQWRLKTERYER
jgi:hypothetical protein